MIEWLSSIEFLIYPFVFSGGFIAGLYGSSVGSGGLISFPTLLLVGLPTHIAIATNRLAAVFLETSAAVRFHKEGAFKLQFGILLGLIAAIGSFIGSNIVLNMQKELLDQVVVAALSFTFLFFLFNGKKKPKQKEKSSIALYASIFLLGIYAGFFGVGFGTFIMIPLVMFGCSYVRSAALSRVIGVIASLVAALVFAYEGVIDYPMGITLGLGYGLGGWIGAGISVKKGDRYIRVLLLFVIIFSVIKLLIR